MRRRRIHRWAWSAVALATVLVAVRLALPWFVTDWVNGKLARMGEYHGSVADVDLALWRGAYVLRDVRIVKRDSEVPVPLLLAPELQLGLSWRALLDGRIVAEATLVEPELNFVDGAGEDNQAGLGVDWRERLEALVPIELNHFTVQRGTVWFRNFHSDPPVDHSVSDVELVINGLTNRAESLGRSASLALTGQVLQQAPLEVKSRFDPLGPLADFNLRLKAEQVELARLNEFLQAYANIDVETGSGEFLLELDAANHRLNGYAKPLFRDVQVFSWENDVSRQEDPPLRLLWESVVGGLENLFKNQQVDQIATRVDIHGELGDVETDTLQAISGVLVNAFVEAYRARFEDLPERPESLGNS